MGERKIVRDHKCAKCGAMFGKYQVRMHEAHCDGKPKAKAASTSSAASGAAPASSAPPAAAAEAPQRKGWFQT